MRFLVLFLSGLVVASLLVGCGRFASAPKAGPPPLKVSFRKSQIPTQGMVAGLTNASSTEVIKVVVVLVQGKNEKEGRSYRIAREVKPLDSISVGWVELDGWKLKPGDALRIRCARYTDDLACEVPD